MPCLKPEFFDFSNIGHFDPDKMARMGGES